MWKSDKGCGHSGILKQHQKDNSRHKTFYVETQIGRKPRATRTAQRSTMIGVSTTRSQQVSQKRSIQKRERS